MTDAGFRASLISDIAPIERAMVAARVSPDAVTVLGALFGLAARELCARDYKVEVMLDGVSAKTKDFTVK